MIIVLLEEPQWLKLAVNLCRLDMALSASVLRNGGGTGGPRTATSTFTQP